MCLYVFGIAHVLFLFHIAYQIKIYLGLLYRYGCSFACSLGHRVFYSLEQT